ncbi:hypothetical protein [Nocardia coubleae]|uniref:Uncharacterized protein n=1 Tax=Nocardia coubleae TaxID=356147 RepID=A0A846W4A3_9NOCA|nr:hypothetical protein [Nocardia coubleae]NKX87683.1 hypothetical protein [Nocardia coubleae]
MKSLVAAAAGIAIAGLVQVSTAAPAAAEICTAPGAHLCPPKSGSADALDTLLVALPVWLGSAGTNP